AAAGVALDQMIELGAVSQDAEDNFGGESGVPRVHAGGLIEEKIGRIPAGFDFAQDVEGDPPGSGQKWAGWGQTFSFPCFAGERAFSRGDRALVLRRGSMNSIYDAIGGQAALEAAVERFYERVTADPELASFFVGM